MNDALRSAPHRAPAPPANSSRRSGDAAGVLAALNRLLHDSLDWEAAFAAVARALPAGFADWCIVYALDPLGAWRQACSVVDPARRDTAERLDKLVLGPPRYLRDAIATERPALFAQIDAATVAREAQSAEHARCLRELGIASSIVAPGRAAGGVVVVLAFVRDASRPGFGRDDVAFACDVAEVAALALASARAVTRERDARRSLAVSEARFRALVDASAQVVWTACADGTPADDAPSWRAFTGQGRDEWRAGGWLAAVHPDDVARAREAWRSAVAAGTALDLECRVRRPDGAWAWTLARATPVRDADGALREWVGAHADISARKAAELALQQSEARLRTTLEVGEIGAWDFDPRSGKLVWSERDKALFGLPTTAQVDHAVFARGIHPDDRAHALEAVARAMDPASGGDYRDEFRTVGLDDGVERWIAARGRCFFDEHGAPVRFVGADLDVTERRNAAQRVNVLAEASHALVLGRKRERVELALAAVARSFAVHLGDVCAVALLDEGGAALQVVALEAANDKLTPQLASMLFARLAVDQDPVRSVVRDAQSLLVPEVDAARRADLLRDVTLRAALEGTALASVMVAPLLDGTAVVGAIGCFRQTGRAYDRADLLLLQDVADRCALAVAEARSFQRAERARGQIEAIIDAVPFPIAGIDADGRYAYVSRGYQVWFGEPRSHFVGRTVREVVGEAAYALVRPMVEGALRGERQDFELTLPYARGGTRDVSAAYVPQFDERGRPVGFVAVIIDISAHKALVESLQRTVRFTEEFVGILGHDLRAPLNAITLTASQLLRQLDEHWAVKPVLRIHNSAGRMARMIEQILDFTRARLGGGIPVVPVPLELRELAAEIVDELQPGAPQPIELSVEGDTRGVWDPDRLGQVLANLLANALSHGSTDAPVRVCVRGTAPDRVELAVWNAGAIPPETLPFVFDRYRRGESATDRKVRGLGLGLYIARQIALAHGGSIEVTSTPEHGTTFTLSVPRVAAASPAREPAEPATQDQG